MAQTGPLMGLRLWNLLGDNYSHDQLKDNFYKIDLHDHSTGRGAPIGTAGLQDGAVTAAKLAPGANALQDDTVTANKLDDTTVLDKLGISGQGVVRRGVTTVAAENTTTSATAVALGDIVSNVNVPVDGLLKIRYRALAKRSAGGSASVYLFVNGTQVVLVGGTLGTSYTGATAGVRTSGTSGLGFEVGVSFDTVDPVFTPNVYAPLLTVEPAVSGLQNVEIRWSVAGGATLSVKQRKLWVEAVGY